MSRACRGMSVLEAVVALAVLTVLAAAAFDGTRAQVRTSRLAQDAQRVRLAAASRLEAHPRRDVVTGRRAFATGAADLEGEEDVVEVQPGLYEVTVRVRAASGPRVTLATRLATGEAP